MSPTDTGTFQNSVESMTVSQRWQKRMKYLFSRNFLSSVVRSNLHVALDIKRTQSRNSKKIQLPKNTFFCACPIFNKSESLNHAAFRTKNMFTPILPVRYVKRHLKPSQSSKKTLLEHRVKSFVLHE